MTGRPMPLPYRLLIAITGAILVLVTVAVVVVARRDGGGGHPARGKLTASQQALVDRAKPDPSCAIEPPPAPADATLVALDVLRLQGTCLGTTTEYLAKDRVTARRAALARDPAVVATGVVQPAELADDD